MRAVVFTLGCKVNEVESAQIIAGLEARGIETFDKLCPADIYILNTCAVTKEAERKSRQLIARALKFNKNASVYVCGCASGKDRAQFEREGVKFICGARDKERIINAVAADFGGEQCTLLPYPKQVKTRAFIKIEDGCNNFCSYCVIPYLRGRVVCRNAEDILKEIGECGAPEIVLTGINISAYDNLPLLLDGLQACEKRIRLGSLECGIITDGFLQACKRLNDFAPQFHLSLQSGSNAVLKAMNRHYTREEYLDKCRLIYSYFPDAAITTDIIAGFCGETDKDFEDSLSIIEEAGFARVHAFAFSPREGTKAFCMQDVRADIKDSRLKALIKSARAAEEKYINSKIETEGEVICEEFDGEYTTGYTAQYIKVYIAGRREGRVKVILKRPFKSGALAEVGK